MVIDSVKNLFFENLSFAGGSLRTDIPTFQALLPTYCPGTTKRRIKEAVIKSAASAATLGLAGECPVPRRPHAGPLSWRSPANPRKAALGADLITASLIPLSAVPGQYSSAECIFQ